MRSDSHGVVRTRYWAAYRAQRACANRVIEKLEYGGGPSREDIAAEANATEELVAARRELLDTMAQLPPQRH